MKVLAKVWSLYYSGGNCHIWIMMMMVVVVIVAVWHWLLCIIDDDLLRCRRLKFFQQRALLFVVFLLISFHKYDDWWGWLWVCLNEFGCIVYLVLLLFSSDSKFDILNCVFLSHSRFLLLSVIVAIFAGWKVYQRVAKLLPWIAIAPAQIVWFSWLIIVHSFAC